MTAPDEFLAPIRERLAAATPGPWFREYSDVVISDPDPSPHFSHYDDPPKARITQGASHRARRDPQGIADAAFIAHARDDVPRLLSAIGGVLAVHNPVTVYEYDDTNGVFVVGDDGEQVEMSVLCTACTGDSVLEAIGDCVYDPTDYHDETPWPCPTVAAITTALEGQA